MASCGISEDRDSLLRRLAAAAVVGTVMLSGCAASDPEGANDPIEGLNRKVFTFNDTLDESVFQPVAQSYVDHVPGTIRMVVHNLLNFLRSPVIFANDVLQGDIDRAGKTLSRVITNGTLGFGGMADVAAESGLPYHEEDFGQTLAVWGLDEGPYLMIPLFGPTNVRDGVGTLVDSVLDPLSFIVANPAISLPRTGANALDTRAGLLDTLDDLKRTSLDYYAAIRSLYRQRRNDEIRNGESDGPVPIPNISFEEYDKTRSDELKPAMRTNKEKLAMPRQTSENPVK